ncbi:hypothetical protein BCR42DRAFT_448138 [Absidia repens]|uniref:Protein ZIP4 homolog n=1 Tax=Absidia repens TaxID=90262 RepID=A0A1X2IS13_9FUNG|nr:hypothetical protein BCR42DRAFT_448138 [Absidia repens]
MKMCPFVTELKVLVSELQTLVALSEPDQVFPLAQRVLEKTGQLDISMDIEEEELIIMETLGVNLWNCATTHLLETSFINNCMNETRATLYHIGYRMLSEAYKCIMDKDIDVLFQLSEMAIFAGSQYTACQQYTHAKELLESANQKLRFQTSTNERQLFPTSEQLCQFQTDLMMAFVELAARQSQWKEVQVLLRKMDETMFIQAETPRQKISLLFYYYFKTATEFVDKKEWDHTLHWTLSFCSSTNDYLQMEEHVLTRLAQIICVALEGRNRDILGGAHTHKLLEIVDGCFKNSRTAFEFHCVKLMILLAGSQSLSSPLELAFLIWRKFWILLLKKIVNFYEGIVHTGLPSHTLGGKTKRCLDSQESSQSDAHFQQLYLFKIYIISEWIFRQNDMDDQLPQNESTIKMILEEMYLVKSRLTDEGLWCCLMILWSVGDTFFEKEKYSCALPWYKQIRSFGLTSLKEDIDLLVLARKLSTCCIRLGDLNNAAIYIETSISDSGVTTTALDYLLLLEITIALKDSEKAGQYLDLLFHAQGFTTEILMSSAYLCHKNENGELLQKILDHAFDISGEYMTQEAFKLHLMTLLRWTIRFCVHTKPGSDIKSIGLLVNKNAIVKYMDKAASYCVSLTGAMSSELKNAKEWVLRTGWNLGLQFYGMDHDAEGAMLFAATSKIICLDIHQGVLENQYMPCLFACMVCRLYSPSFNQLNESERITMSNEILSLIKKLSDMQPEKTFDSIVALIQVQCYATLNMFDNALDIFTHYGERLGQSVTLHTLEVFERLAGTILQCETCPQTVATPILKMVSCVLQQQDGQDNKIVEKWAKWNRMYVSLAMIHQNKEEVFNYITQLLASLSNADGIPYPQREIHYLVIITWNEGMIRCHNSDANQGEQWCRLAHDLLSHLDASHNAIKDQINRAFRHLGKSIET